MSDLEPLQLRKLPPVEPIRVPARMSQTLLRHAEDCPRSAYLYMKYRGGRPARPLDRGTIAHMVLERLLGQLVATGEESYAAGEERDVASLTAAVVSEVVSEHPEFVARPSDWDDVREIAYHWALGYDVSPSSLLGIEQTYVIDVPTRDGTVWEVRGKIDVAYVIGEEGEAGVDDYKTTFDALSDTEYAETFQGRLYAILLCFGQPVEQADCGPCADRGHVAADCEVCGGRGWAERRLERQGDWIQAVQTREVYPRFLHDDGTLRYARNTLTRQELQDARHDLALLVQLVADRFESWEFPAIHGPHCSLCPAKLECPLPEHLRDHAGTINTLEEAQEAMVKVAHDEDHLAARRAELRRWVAAHGAVEVNGEEYVIVSTKKRSVKRKGKRTDWEGFLEAVAAAVEFGEPFDPADWIRESASSNFKRRAVSGENNDAEEAA